MRRWPAQGHGGVELLCVRESVAGEGGREREKEKWKRKRKNGKKEKGERERDSLGGFRGGDRGRSGVARRSSVRDAWNRKERDDTVIDFGCRGGDPMG